MKIGIYVNINKPQLSNVIDLILDEFIEPKYDLIFLNEQKSIRKTNKIDQYINVDKKYDIMFTIGGDGTILSAIRSEYKKEIPILGIHAGNLGFLAEADIENCKSIFRLIKKSKYSVESRSLFEISISKNDTINKYICANDIVIDRGESARTMKANVYENNTFVNKYEGDGLIVSTANGSTAYSLSAGGPIIYPSLDLITITPICSHSLSTRTIVLDGNSNIEISFPDSKDTRTLTIDGQVNFNIKDDMVINVTAAKEKANFILTENSDYYQKLRNKMGWFVSKDDQNIIH